VGWSIDRWAGRSIDHEIECRFEYWHVIVLYHFVCSIEPTIEWLTGRVTCLTYIPQAEAADLRRQVEDLTRRNDDLSKQLAKYHHQQQQQQAAAAAGGEGAK
jgi:cell division protein FtsB